MVYEWSCIKEAGDTIGDLKIKIKTIPFYITIPFFINPPNPTHADCSLKETTQN